MLRNAKSRGNRFESGSGSGASRNSDVLELILVKLVHSGSLGSGRRSRGSGSCGVYGDKK